MKGSSLLDGSGPLPFVLSAPIQLGNELNDLKKHKKLLSIDVRHLGSGLHVESGGGERVQVTNSRCHHAQRL
jgi:hypothetical protein